MKRTVLATLIALTAAVPALAVPATTTVRVNCAKGETIATALGRNGAHLDIVLSGTCNEIARINRDLVTIRGEAGASVNGTLIVDGASNVTIRDLAIRNGPDSCIIIRHNAGAVVRNALLEDCGNRGILLEGSAATVVDTTIRRCGTVGILNRTSRVELDGNVTVSDAGVACISATDGAVIYLNPDDHPATVTMERSLLGLVSQLSSEITLAEGTIIARDNQLAGILVASQGVIVHGTATIEASSNDVFGLYLDELSNLSPFVGFGATFNITNNGVDGVFVERGSALELTGTTNISGNGGHGINVDGGLLRVNGTNVGGVNLTFGTRAEFGSGNTIGSVTCDSTVLVRGSAACAPLTAAQTTTAPKPGVDVKALIARARAALRDL